MPIIEPHDVDLGELWVLNGLVLRPRDLDSLICYPSDSCYWRYPGEGVAYRLPSARRLEHVKACIDRGEVDCFRRSLDGESYTRITGSDTESFLNLSSSVEPIVLSITHAGQSRWENVLKPNWDRFFMVGDYVRDESGCYTEFAVQYGDPSYFATLEKHLPYWTGYSPEAVASVSKSTLLGERVTYLKILPLSCRAVFILKPMPSERGRLIAEYNAGRIAMSGFVELLAGVVRKELESQDVLRRLCDAQLSL